MISRSRQPLVSLWRRSAVFFGLFLSCFVTLYTTISDYGITWDEAETNFPAARRQAEWFRLLLNGQDVANEVGVRTYFETESDHPSLPRTLMAVSRLLLPESMPDRFVFALPTSLLTSLFTTFFFNLLWKRSGLLLALYGSLILFLHPHWFGHAHFAEYDILVAMAWFLAAFSFYSAIENKDEVHTKRLGLWSHCSLAAIAFGLAVSVKVHAMFLPFPLLAWAVLHRRWRVWRWGLLCAIAAPVLYVVTQPYLWWHLLDRVFSRFHDYGAKVPINVYYFGSLYPGNVPWHYSWVMLLVTLPVGLVIPILCWIVPICRQRFKSSTDQASGSLPWFSFLALNALTLPFVFTFKSAYDGVRFFLSSLPFLALLTVMALESCKDYLSHRLGKSTAQHAITGICLLLLSIQVYTCWRIHPHQLAYYSFLTGGIRGAASRGLETTIWCDSVTPKFIRRLAEKIPANARVATHAMDAHPLIEYQRMGIAPTGWTFIKEGPADCRILQFRQGFFGPLEYRLSQEREPIVKTEVDGVPLACAYSGP